MAVYWSRGFARNMAGLAWLDGEVKEEEGEQEGVMKEEDGMVAKEEEEEEWEEEGEVGER